MTTSTHRKYPTNRACRRDRMRTSLARAAMSLMSDALGQRFRMRVAAAALRTVEHRGGLDAFLMKERDASLSPKAALLKRQVAKKMAEREAA